MTKLHPLFQSILAPMRPQSEERTCPRCGVGEGDLCKQWSDDGCPNAAPQANGMRPPSLAVANTPAVAAPVYEPPPRTASVIVASIRTASLTLQEQGEILGEIASRICMCIREYPELEETCHDLSQTYEAYKEAEDSINDRLYKQHGPGKEGE